MLLSDRPELEILEAEYRLLLRGRDQLAAGGRGTLRVADVVIDLPNDVVEMVLRRRLADVVKRMSKIDVQVEPAAIAVDFGRPR